MLAWLFSNTVYALHYAHLFYQPGMTTGRIRAGSISRRDEPDYWDFVYFSFTLGMTFQTSDVEITSRDMRRVVIGQCLAAFVFNIGVLAFTINVLGRTADPPGLDAALSPRLDRRASFLHAESPVP